MNYLTKNSNKDGNKVQLNKENNTEPRNSLNGVTNHKENQILEQNSYDRTEGLGETALTVVRSCRKRKGEKQRTPL